MPSNLKHDKLITTQLNFRKKANKLHFYYLKRQITF